MKLLALLSLPLVVAPETKARKTYVSDPVFVFENGLPDDVRGDGSSFSLRRTEGWVRSRRVYDDFVLELQFRVSDEVTGVGIALRTPIKDAVWASKGYVLWLTGDHAGKLLSRAGGELKPIQGVPGDSLPPGEWHSVKITCKTSRISVATDKNSERLFDVTPTTGSIVLLATGGPVDFRKIVVHEMEQIVDLEHRPAAPPGVFRVHDLTESPRVLHEVKPHYTRAAMQRKAQGFVDLEAIVQEDGSVGEVAVIKRLDPDLDDEAAAAVKQWRFTPATRDGKPVPVLVTIELTFTLK